MYYLILRIKILHRHAHTLMYKKNICLFPSLCIYFSRRRDFLKILHIIASSCYYFSDGTNNRQSESSAWRYECCIHWPNRLLLEAIKQKTKISTQNKRRITDKFHTQYPCSTVVADSLKEFIRCLQFTHMCTHSAEQNEEQIFLPISSFLFLSFKLHYTLFVTANFYLENCVFA